MSRRLAPVLCRSCSVISRGIVGNCVHVDALLEAERKKAARIARKHQAPCCGTVVSGAIAKKILEMTNHYKCQFCEKESPSMDWVDDKCPKCKKKYDPILAQEGDD